MDAMVGGARKRLVDQLGEGGEATIYWLDDAHSAVAKVYKGPDHPDFAMQVDGPEAARRRIEEHQRKLPKIIDEYAASLAAVGAVIVPRSLILSTSKAKRIIGYTMDAVPDSMPLSQLSRPAFRKGDAVSNQQIVKLFLQMSSVVSGVHGLGVVIGDFNEMNVLVVIPSAAGDPIGNYIDVDSWQFPGFPCRMFTQEFVDPLLCDPARDFPELVRPHNAASDDYALNCMLFRSLLLVDPFGGIYRPKQGQDKVNQRARKMGRISVLHDGVGMPNWATSYDVLPDDLLDHFLNVFERDAREPFPVHLVESMRWTRCSACGSTHARNRCPQCDKPTGIVTEVSRGDITVKHLFRTGGTILVARSHAGLIKFLVHRDGHFALEDGRELLTGNPLPKMRFRMSDRATYVGHGNSVMEFGRDGNRRRYSVDSYEGMPSFDVNSKTLFWTFSNVLYRSNEMGGQVPVTSVLSGHTLFWVGEEFGVGFYRASEIQRTFLFETEGASIVDVPDVPRVTGHLVDAKCFLSKTRAWLLFTISDGGRTVNRCMCISQHGAVLGVAEADDGDASWLGNIRGKVASRAGLLSASGDGLVMVAPDVGRIEVSAHFGDTEDFVQPGCGLQPGEGGSLFVIDRQRISLLTFDRRRTDT